MKSKRVTLIMTVLMLMIGCITLYSQNSKSESREAYIQRMLLKEFDKYGLTEEKISKLNENGIDLRQGKAPSPEIIGSIYTDAVVIVKTIGVLDLPGPKKQLFHSNVRVCIQEVLKGKANVGDTIEIFEESGPVTGLEKADHIAVSCDARFSIGEESILYLRRMNKDNYLTSPHIKRGYDLSNIESDSVHFYVGEGSKISIQNGKVSVGGQTMDVSQFKSNIKKVTAILEKE